MTPGWRKLALTIHLVFSVGWIGAIVAYLTLVFAAMFTSADRILLAAWVAMQIIIQLALVPLAIVSLITGLTMALGTKWGLFRYYWVLFSLILTIFAVLILVGHTPTVIAFGDLTAHQAAQGDDIAKLREGLPGELVHAGLGLLVLLVVQVLNVYKPPGVTPWATQAPISS